MTIRRHSLTYVLAFAVLLISAMGCQTDSTNRPTDTGVNASIQSQDGFITGLTWSVTKLITPVLGGTVDLLDSKLVIAPTALLMPTMISFTISVDEPTGLNGGLNHIFTFGPDGTRFLIPAKLIVAFSDAGLGTRNPHQYSLFYYNPQQNSWEEIPTIVDVARQQFIVELDHFSQYAFGRNQ